MFSHWKNNSVYLQNIFVLTLANRIEIKKNDWTSDNICLWGSLVAFNWGRWNLGQCCLYCSSGVKVSLSSKFLILLSSTFRQKYWAKPILLPVADNSCRVRHNIRSVSFSLPLLSDYWRLVIPRIISIWYLDTACRIFCLVFGPTWCPLAKYPWMGRWCP